MQAVVCRFNPSLITSVASKIPFFAGIDDCRFKRVVEPGDVLELECEFLRIRGPIAKGQGKASVDGDVAAEAMLTVFVGNEG